MEGLGDDFFALEIPKTRPTTYSNFDAERAARRKHLKTRGAEGSSWTFEETQESWIPLRQAEAKAIPRPSSATKFSKDVVHKALDPKEEAEVVSVLRRLDKDGSGSISIDELEQAFLSLHLKPDQDLLEVLLRDYDEDGSGELDYDEFIPMYKEVKQLIEDKGTQDKNFIAAPNIGDTVLAISPNGGLVSAKVVDVGIENMRTTYHLKFPNGEVKHLMRGSIYTLKEAGVPHSSTDQQGLLPESKPLTAVSPERMYRLGIPREEYSTYEKFCYRHMFRLTSWVEGGHWVNVAVRTHVVPLTDSEIEGLLERNFSKLDRLYQAISSQCSGTLNKNYGVVVRLDSVSPNDQAISGFCHLTELDVVAKWSANNLKILEYHAKKQTKLPAKMSHGASHIAGKFATPARVKEATAIATKAVAEALEAKKQLGRIRRQARGEFKEHRKLDVLRAKREFEEKIALTERDLGDQKEKVIKLKDQAAWEADTDPFIKDKLKKAKRRLKILEGRMLYYKDELKVREKHAQELDYDETEGVKAMGEEAEKIEEVLWKIKQSVQGFVDQEIKRREDEIKAEEYQEILEHRRAIIKCTPLPIPKAILEANALIIQRGIRCKMARKNFGKITNFWSHTEGRILSVGPTPPLTRNFAISAGPTIWSYFKNHAITVEGGPEGRETQIIRRYTSSRQVQVQTAFSFEPKVGARFRIFPVHSDVTRWALYSDVFHDLDPERVGTLDRLQLSRALRRLQLEMEEEDLDDLISFHDRDGEGTVSFKEFMAMLRQPDILQRLMELPLPLVAGQTTSLNQRNAKLLSLAEESHSEELVPKLPSWLADASSPSISPRSRGETRLGSSGSHRSSEGEREEKEGLPASDQALAPLSSPALGASHFSESGRFATVQKAANKAATISFMRHASSFKASATLAKEDSRKDVFAAGAEERVVTSQKSTPVDQLRPEPGRKEQTEHAGSLFGVARASVLFRASQRTRVSASFGFGRSPQAPSPDEKGEASAPDASAPAAQRKLGFGEGEAAEAKPKPKLTRRLPPTGGKGGESSFFGAASLQLGRSFFTSGQNFGAQGSFKGSTKGSFKDSSAAQKKIFKSMSRRALSRKDLTAVLPPEYHRSGSAATLTRQQMQQEGGTVGGAILSMKFLYKIRKKESENLRIQAKWAHFGGMRDVVGFVKRVSPPTAHPSIASILHDKVAVIDSGREEEGGSKISFVSQCLRAEKAGAVAVIVVNMAGAWRHSLHPLQQAPRAPARPAVDLHLLSSGRLPSRADGGEAFSMPLDADGADSISIPCLMVEFKDKRLLTDGSHITIKMYNEDRKVQSNSWPWNELSIGEVEDSVRHDWRGMANLLLRTFHRVQHEAIAVGSTMHLPENWTLDQLKDSMKHDGWRPVSDKAYSKPELVKLANQMNCQPPWIKLERVFKVTMHKATNLPKMEKHRKKPNSFVRVTFNDQSRDTKIIPESFNPNWNETFKFKVTDNDLRSQELKIARTKFDTLQSSENCLETQLLPKMFENTQIKLDAEMLPEIVEKYDENGSGTVEWEEFVTIYDDLAGRLESFELELFHQSAAKDELSIGSVAVDLEGMEVGDHQDLTLEVLTEDEDPETEEDWEVIGNSNRVTMVHLQITLMHMSSNKESEDPAKDALQIVMESRKCMHELRCVKALGGVDRFPYALCVREFMNDLSNEPWREFRCFIHQGILTSASQKCTSVYFPELQPLKDRIRMLIVGFFWEFVEKRMRDESLYDYIMDIFVVPDSGEVSEHCIVSNFLPFHPSVDACLFDWNNPRDARVLRFGKVFSRSEEVEIEISAIGAKAPNIDLRINLEPLLDPLASLHPMWSDAARGMLKDLGVKSEDIGFGAEDEDIQPPDPKPRGMRGAISGSNYASSNLTTVQETLSSVCSLM